MQIQAAWHGRGSLYKHASRAKLPVIEILLKKINLATWSDYLVLTNVLMFGLFGIFVEVKLGLISF